MSDDDIDNARLIVEIDIAPKRLAEFVIFRISTTHFHNLLNLKALKCDVSYRSPAREEDSGKSRNSPIFNYLIPKRLRSFVLKLVETDWSAERARTDLTNRQDWLTQGRRGGFCRAVLRLSERGANGREALHAFFWWRWIYTCRLVGV